MGFPISALGQDIVLERAGVKAMAKHVLVSINDAQRIVAAWADDPANGASVLAARARLVGSIAQNAAIDAQLRSSPEAVALARAAILRALAEGKVVAFARRTPDLPLASSSPRTMGTVWAALIVRDVTGTPLRGVRAFGLWDDGPATASPEITTTGDQGVAVWSYMPSDPEATRFKLNIRVVLPNGSRPCDPRSGKWVDSWYDTPAVFATRSVPAVLTMWIRFELDLPKRFAWQNADLRRTLYPFRNAMLRRLLHLDRQTAYAERLQTRPKELAQFIAESKADVAELNEASAAGDAAAVKRLSRWLGGVVSEAKKPSKKGEAAQFALKAEIGPRDAARVLADRWLDGPEGPRTRGHRRLIAEVSEVLARQVRGPSGELQPAYPTWARYLLLHFSGMVYRSAHGSLGRPDTLLRLLRLGATTKPAISNGPGAELDREIQSATPEQLVALALESAGVSSWFPDYPSGTTWPAAAVATRTLGLEKLVRAAGPPTVVDVAAMRAPMQTLYSLLEELSQAGLLERPVALSPSVLGALRGRTLDIWKGSGPYGWQKGLCAISLAAAAPDDWLAQLVRRKFDADETHFVRFPNADVWRVVAGNTPLRATFGGAIPTKWNGKAWLIAFPRLALAPGADSQTKRWAEFIGSWLADPKYKHIPSGADGGVDDWRGYNARTLEPIVCGVCNENNEMSYHARGLLLTSGGGLRDNARDIFKRKGGGGDFASVTKTGQGLAGLDPRVDVGDSLFSLGEDPFPPSARDAWNVVDPQMRSVLAAGHQGSETAWKTPGIAAPLKVLRHTHSHRQSRRPEDPAGLDVPASEPPLAASLVGGPSVTSVWKHEIVVVRVDPWLDRVLVHDTALPTGLHELSAASTVGRFAAKFGSHADEPAVAAEALRRAELIEEHLLPDPEWDAGDDGEDPSPDEEPLKSYIGTVGKVSNLVSLVQKYGPLKTR